MLWFLIEIYPGYVRPAFHEYALHFLILLRAERRFVKLNSTVNRWTLEMPRVCSSSYVILTNVATILLFSISDVRCHV